MRSKHLPYSLLILIFLLNNFGIQQVSSSAPDLEVRPGFVETRNFAALTYSNMLVELDTPAYELIEFERGETETTTTETRKIPHLVLNRNGVLTPSYERTLNIVVSHMPVSAPGIFVKLIIFTQHKDPDYESRDGQRIQVWNEIRFIPQTSQNPQDMTINFHITFDRLTKFDYQTIAMPTDYFQYRLTIVDVNDIVKFNHNENYAFLMENQWRVPLPRLMEAESGSAPERLLIYYCDMIPFQADKKNPFTRILRQYVDRYIQTELLPAMIEALQMQSNDWGFVWYPEWRNYRRDENPKTLSIALGEYSVWFHGQAPSLGHSMISIRVDGSVGEYDNLTDGLMSIFHHELFHNLQRNIDLHFGGNGDVSGMDQAWIMFSEGTAVLASSVGQPQVQIGPESASRGYMKRANAFIGSDGVFYGGLNKSYEKIPYYTALYWRFLYEKCGGINNGIEDSTAGMKVIHNVLETLYSGEIVDIHASNYWTEMLPRILDHALAESACPFHDYESSLSEFARSIYSLRLANGRCNSVVHHDCGFYDPYSLYNMPPVEHALITARPAKYINGNIATSYGIDFIELTPDLNPKGQSFQIVFDRSSASNADFTVQLVMIKSSESKEILVKESNLLTTANGRITFETGEINLNEIDCLGLIIIRTDANEIHDARGSYTVQVLRQY